jgi:hypothetical protein
LCIVTTDADKLRHCHCALLLPLPLQLPFTTCAYELAFFGINLKKLVLNNNKDFLFSEVGVGGGASDGRCEGAATSTA